MIYCRHSLENLLSLVNFLSKDVNVSLIGLPQNLQTNSEHVLKRVLFIKKRCSPVTMYRLEGSQEQSVPQTPPIFHELPDRSTYDSPFATVPNYSDFSLSQGSQDSQEANVSGTPVIQSTLHSFLTPTTPVNLNRRPHHNETPLLEIVLLRSARKHTITGSEQSLRPNDSPGTPQLEQTVPCTPKKNVVVINPYSNIRLSPVMSPCTPKQNVVVMNPSSNIRLSPVVSPTPNKCENLNIFNDDDEIFLK
ncbi:uncharacterized protein LOC143067308 isoform X1 [Mytilus galloprovincialis]|uniref:uncharacterized protein LOC143067308 isoform X1 n=2 Tax=Mytilus galloprovincialis TaxID=29158 RepID=UPI003F7CC845